MQVAPMLLGWVIERQFPGATVQLKIVETEAYHQDDPASHSYRGQTKRTAPMFKSAGHIYVYFTYGRHYCINIVTGPAGQGEAVLLRAAEPLNGIRLIRQNRQTAKGDIQLTNGPGKLAQALGITNANMSGKLLGNDTFILRPPDKQLKKSDIVITTRVGISKAAKKPWRFYIAGNPYVSPPKLRLK